MAIIIKKKSATDIGLLRMVEERSGVDLGACLQCRKCTSGCPVAGLIQSPPSEIIRRLHLGAGNELLESDLVWMCLSCGTCYARCPMKIDIASVIDTMRALALEKGASRPKGDMPLFNREFLRTVEGSGRSYDLSTIIGYKMGTKSFMKDVDKFPAMLKKRKIALLPPSGADKKMVKQIFSKTRGDKGTGK
jgi:heterodisulfide reductase subunit C2